jgi:hypothetical protein
LGRSKFKTCKEGKQIEGRIELVICFLLQSRHLLLFPPILSSGSIHFGEERAQKESCFAWDQLAKLTGQFLISDLYQIQDREWVPSHAEVLDLWKKVRKHFRS